MPKRSSKRDDFQNALKVDGPKVTVVDFMAKNFNTLRAKMSPESLARAHAKAAKYTEEMALDELRAARDLTQET